MTDGISETARFVRAVRAACSANPGERTDSVTAVSRDVDTDLVRRTIATVCEAYARSAEWRIVVPGNRTKDLSSMALFEILDRRHSIELLTEPGIRTKIEAALKSKFRDRVPSRGALNATASKVILDASYNRFRRGHGLDTGILRSQLKQRGYVVYTK